MKHARPDYNRIQDPAGLIPDDEPVFLIRAQDAASGAAVCAWAQLAEMAGADPAIVQMARDHAARMNAWPSKKTPDLPATAPAAPVDYNTTQLAGGGPVTDDHREINPATGQQKGYVVLSPEERAKGFVRPVRRSYVHVGRKVCGKLRGGTALEPGAIGVLCTMEPGHDGDCRTFQEVTRREVDRFSETGRLGGCGAVTKMSQDIAETYSRDPSFYSGTFCCSCRTHRPLAEFVWDGTEETVGS